MSAAFGDRLAAAVAAHGPLCVGIDPHAGLLAQWGLDDDAAGVRSFGLTVVEQLAGKVAALKPQSAFFERHGSRGVAALEDVLAAAREAGVLTVLDVKRGDIGSTMGGYAAAYLDDASPLRADSITLSPYLGLGSLNPALELARQTGRGAFVLALTSNPEGASVQHARAGERSVAASIVAGLAELNDAERAGGATWGSFGVVVGATIGDAAQATGTDLPALHGPILAPGVGAQGAGPEDLQRVFGTALPYVLASSSRGVLKHGPAGLAQAAQAEAAAMRAVVAQAAGGAATSATQTAIQGGAK
ncbi:orotidine-5'-phosphate decarboxylase [Buchananella felis]|uniref:orotidine-5'-phosphate decarboxylase n=1 Tax=Buchananella felis TaxID=3231492 RepID=UPI003529C251